MLTSLRIENVAIIESAAIEFGCGLNVLTGETGAGKSIVIDSINAVLGERTSKELIRTGADSAKVFAVFEDINKRAKEILIENEIESDDEALIISRTINRDGKNNCRINGYPTPVATLKILGRELIDIHGQHDNQTLLSPEKHCGFVDSFAKNEKLKNEYSEAYKKLCSIRQQLKSINIDESEKAQRIDMLTYQIDELEKAEIRVGEQDELNSRKLLFNNSQKVIDSLNLAYSSLKDDSAAIDMIGIAALELDRAGEYLSSVNDTASKISEMKYELEDAAEIIRDSLSELEYNPNELEEIEERLDVLYKLSRKYGESEEEMLEYLENARKELESISMAGERLEELKSDEKMQFRIADGLACELSDVRKEEGQKLSKAICNELEFLDMPNVSFIVESNNVQLNENGKDDIEFLISANAGEQPKPIAKIASGGELSRIMLAIKNVLADSDGADTMIFDEIDTGVSGSAAQKIALKLRSVAEKRQVVCVTHLAQIASQGDVQLYISKSVHDGKTFTDIKSLIGEDRVKEIARIMGGIDITEIQLASAREMLSSAGNL